MKRPLLRLPVAAVRPSRRSAATQVEALEDRRLLATAVSFGQLPLGFEANQGQVSAPVAFLARSGGSTLFITPDAATLAVPTSAHSGTALRMSLLGAAATPVVAGSSPLPGATNYLAGSDATGAHLGVASYAAVVERGVYPGVDLTYHGSGQKLEYDFTVAPGADPSAIRLQFAGQDSATLDAAGNLVLHTAAGTVVEQAPTLYQAVGNSRQAVAGHYTLGAEGTVGFAVGTYNKTLPLVIDPVLGFSTLLGGGGQAAGHIAVDAAGDTYLIGTTLAPSYPTTPGSYQTMASDTTDGAVVVSKLDPTGSKLIYSTYVGVGQSTGIAIDASGNAYLTGFTASASFPTTTGAFSTTPPNTANQFDDAFVAKLNPTGTALTYSTLLGSTSGTSQTFGIAVDASGNAYVTGLTGAGDFPTTAGAFQTTAQPNSDGFDGYQEAFVTKINPTGTALVYSTFIGGADDAAAGEAIAVDPAGEAVITGIAAGSSDTFPTTSGAYLKSDAGLNEVSVAFVTKFNASGSGLIYSTYLAGPGTSDPTLPPGESNGSTFGNAVALDSAGDIYVTGAFSATTFPTTTGAYAPAGSTLFLTKIDPTSPNLVYSSIFGGPPAAVATTPFSEGSNALVVDAAGDAYVTGATTSANYPTVNPIQSAFGGGVLDASTVTYPTDAFVSEFNPAGTGLVFSTYLGGSGNEYGSSIALNPAGDIYVQGNTSSSNFPTTAGAYDPTYAKVDATNSLSSNDDFFLARIIPSAQFALATTTVPAGSSSAVVTITRTGNTNGTATVTVATSDGTARAGTDYTPVTQVLTFAPGVTSQDVTIPLSAPTGATGTRTVNLTLSNPTGDLGLGQLATAALAIAAPSATTTSLTARPGTAVEGQAVTLLARIVPTVGSTTEPSGTVTFRDGIFELGSAPLDAAGNASFTTTQIGAGIQTITATYSGDTAYTASSGTTTATVTAPSMTTFNSGPRTAAVGDPVGIRATVNADGIGQGADPGTVVFTVDGVAQAPVALQLAGSVGGSASADLTLANLLPGTHVVTATYSGTVVNPPSTASLTVTVEPVAATVGLTEVPSKPVAGQPYVLIASPRGVDQSPGTPTGFAQFLDGSTVIATLPLDSEGNAVLFIPNLSAAAHLFTVVYSGDTTYNVAINRTANYVLGPPTVGAVSRIPSGLLIPFDQDLDQTSAQLLSNYRVSTTGNQRIGVQSATYDTSTQSVSLRLAVRSNYSGGYRFRINGTSPAGIKGTNGQFLAGSRGPGTDLIGTVSPVFRISGPIVIRAAHPSGPVGRSG